ncbi:hypothetical protein QE152_g27349 [Popillia japonica]|uniref:Reverse transcriptase n=1 Tax=Popillia japonica TaxID=7064 RepID=A0AAW1JVQ4_POPJA
MEISNVPIANANTRKGIRDERMRLKHTMLLKWQDRWVNRENGRTTYGFIPEVRNLRHRTSVWFRPNLRMTYILTAHGYLKHKLFELGLVDSDLCECGEVENVKHVLEACSLLVREQSLPKPSRVKRFPQNKDRLSRYTDALSRCLPSDGGVFNFAVAKGGPYGRLGPSPQRRRRREEQEKTKKKRERSKIKQKQALQVFN